MTVSRAPHVAEPPPVEHWTPIAKTSPIPGVQLHPDGRFQVDLMEFGQRDGVRNTTIDDIFVDKRAGEGEPLTVRAGKRLCRYKYEDGRWYESVAAPSHPAPPPLPPSPGTGKKIPFGPFQIPDLRPYVHRYRWALAAAAVLILGVWVARLLPKGPPNRDLQDQLAGQMEANRLQQQLLDEQQKKLDLDAIQRQRDSEQAAAEQKRIANEAAAEAKARQDAAARAQEAALLQARLSDIRSRGHDLVTRHRQLVAEIKTWDSLLKGILTNETGRRLAVREDSVRLFLSEVEKTRPPLDSVILWEHVIRAILQPIEDALASDAPAYRPSDEVDQTLNSYFEKIAKLTGEYAASRRLLEGLAAAAQPGDQTLQAAIEALIQADAAKRAAIVDRETAELRKQEDYEEAERKKREIADRIAWKKKEDEEARLARIAAEMHEKLLKESALTDVEKTLAIFFTPGYIQPKGDSWEKEAELRPFSLSRLRAAGALDATEKGLGTLLFFVANRHEEVRPKWAFVTVLHMLSPAQMAQLKKAQDYLNKYGDVLVERKKLAP